MGRPSIHQGQPFFQVVILRLPFSDADPPPVIVDDDADVIGIIEVRRASIERGVVELPVVSAPSIPSHESGPVGAKRASLRCHNAETC